jgi:antitoxin FitA
MAGCRQRAAKHNRSAEQERREILQAVLRGPRRRRLAEVLGNMPDVGEDSDFIRRQSQLATAAVYLVDTIVIAGRDRQLREAIIGLADGRDIVPGLSENAMFKSARLVILAWTAISALALTCGEAAADTSCPQVGFVIVEPHASAETRPVRVGKNQRIYVQRVPITKTRDIVDIKLGGNDFDANIQLKFTPAATERLIDATNNHAGRRIAFMYDDEVLVDVLIPGPNGFDADGAQVSIRHGMTIARKLMKAIRGCTGATPAATTP